MVAQLIFPRFLTIVTLVVGVCAFANPTTGQEIPEQKATVKWRVPAHDFPDNERKIAAFDEKLALNKIDRLPTTLPIIGADEVYAIVGGTITPAKLVAIHKNNGKRVWSFPYPTDDLQRLYELASKTARQNLINFNFVAPNYHMLQCDNEHVVCKLGGVSHVKKEETRIRIGTIGKSEDPFGIHSKIGVFSIEKQGASVSRFPDSYNKDEEFSNARTLGFQLFARNTLTAVEQNSECWFTEFPADTPGKRQSLLLEEVVPKETAEIRTVTGCAIDANKSIAVCAPAGRSIYGVNRENCKLQWTFRYKPIKDFASKVTELKADHWQFSLAKIVGDVAIVAPGDSNELFCLDIADGKIKWKLPRKDALYAQVGGESVVVVGATSLRVVKLADGEPAVEPIALPGKERTVGRGCWKDGGYLLPVSTDSILRIDLKKGAIVRRYLLDSKPGNLAETDTGVVSQSALTISHFKIR